MATENIVNRPGIVYYSCTHSDGTSSLEQATALFGSVVHGIVGNNNSDDVIALTEKGVFDLNTSKIISDSEFITFSCGYNHCVGSLANGEIYSWGEGRYGELGLGSGKVLVDKPTKIPLNAAIKSISTGDYYTLAQDTSGSVFGWGQNFDRQLGLYMTKVTDMPNNCVVEQMTYAPKLLPISLKEDKVKSVSCGPNFSLCVTASGKVFSWGAGECGQLGTGRCTSREVPEQVSITYNNGTTATISNIACGTGHVLAVTNDGKLFGWGLNKHGQLGLGDTKTRYVSMEISHDAFDTQSHPLVHRNEIHCQTVFADGYSSALIDQQGRLYTWGSTIHNRLMHSPNVTHGKTFISHPTLVSSLVGNDVYNMAFSKKSSAIMINAKLHKLNPINGPQKSMSELHILGCGFYQSDTIIVKFTSKNPESLRTAPRSCLGKYLSPTEISCKPPKLSDYGDFDVSLSLDGKVFIPDALKLKVYKDFSIADISPKFVDKRLVENNTISVKLNCKHLSVDVGSEVQVRFHVTIHSDSSETAAKTVDIKVKGIVTAEETPTHPVSPSASGDHDHMTVNHSVDASMTSLGGPSTATEASDMKVVVCDFDYSVASITDDDGSVVSAADSSLVIIQAQISANDQDYCPMTTRGNSILCHCFDPVNVSPSCCPLDISLGNKMNSIYGSSFIPSNFIPKGMEIYATMKVLELPKDVAFSNAMTSDIPIALPWEGILSVKAESFNEMTIKSADMVKQIEQYLQVLNNALGFDAEGEEDEEFLESPRRRTIGDIKAVHIELKFFIKYRPKYRASTSTSPFTTEELSSSGVHVTLFTPVRLEVSPKVLQINNGSETSPDGVRVTIVRSEPITFTCSKARVVIRSHRSTLSESVVASIDTVYFEEILAAISEEADESKSNAEGDKRKDSVLSGKAQESQTKRENDPHELDDDHMSSVDNMSLSSRIQENAIKTPHLYAMSFMCPPLSKILSPILMDEADTEVNVRSSDNNLVSSSIETILAEKILYFDLQMDGSTPSPEACMCRVPLIDSVSIVTPIVVPKGGAPAKSSLSCQVMGLVEGISSSDIMLRIRGINDKEATVTGEVACSDDIWTVTFQVPETAALSQVKPEGKGKEKKYFLDISIDSGLSYHRSATAILQLK